MKTKSGWRGYNFSRPIAGSSIPQRVQNLVIRNYCTGAGIEYLLSATEYLMDHSYMILHTVCTELDSIEGIVLYSVHMLPESPAERNAVYEKVLKSGAGLRFALEELTILKREDVVAIEELLLCKDLISSVKIDETIFSC